MGIDVYMKWEGQTKEEEDAQCKGFSIVSGDAGYLREAYHGEPYATKVLVLEAFGSYTDEGVPFEAKTLKERLPSALRACSIRYAGEDILDRAMQSYRDFVALAEKMEEKTKKPVRIVVSY